MLVILGWIGLFVPIVVGITIYISNLLEGWLSLPIPQWTEDNTKNVNVMCCLRCVEKRIENDHFNASCNSGRVVDNFTLMKSEHVACLISIKEYVLISMGCVCTRQYRSPTLHLTLLLIPRWSVEGLVGGVLGWGELNVSFSFHFRVIKRILESKISSSLNSLELGSIIRLW